MPFDGELPTMTTTAHKVENLTSVSALAMYDGAVTTADKVRAAAAMAHVLRTMPVAAPKRARKPVEAETGTLTAERLAKALKAVREVIQRKSTIPVLSNVRLWTTEGRLNLAGTDLDRHFETFISAPDLDPMDLTVSAEGLAKALDGAKGPVTLSVLETEALEVTAGGQTSRLASIPSGDFPEMSLVKPICSALMDAAMLRDVLGFVQPGISQEETRYYLNGVYMRRCLIAGENKLTFVATDGHRMFVQHTPDVDWDGNLKALQGTGADNPGIIIPRAVVTWALRNLPMAGDVLVEISPLKISFTANDMVFRAKLIDGNYPDYQRAIPRSDDFKTTISGDGITMATEVRRLAKLAGRSVAAYVTLQLEKGQVSGLVRDAEGTKATRSITAKGRGEPKSWRLNAAYLADALDHGAVVMALSGMNADPIRVDYPERPDRLAVLMPLRD